MEMSAYFNVECENIEYFDSDEFRENESPELQIRRRNNNNLGKHSLKSLEQAVISILGDPVGVAGRFCCDAAGKISCKLTWVFD
jgi:hypothetical protein